MPAPSMRAASSTLDRDRLEDCFMMNTPVASTSSGRISAGVAVVEAELLEHQELRDQQHDAGHGHHRDDRWRRWPARPRNRSRARA